MLVRLTPRAALAVVGLVFGACGARDVPHRVPSAGNATAAWLDLSPGTRFAIAQTFDVTRPGAEPYHRDVTLDIELGERTVDGTEARAVFVREGDPVPLAGLELLLAPDGAVADWRLVCGGAGHSDLEITVPHLIALVRPGSPTAMRTDFTPEPIPAQRLQRDAHRETFRGHARLADTHFRNLHLTGLAEVRAIVDRGADGLPTARIRIDFEGLVTPYGEPAQQATVQIDERITVTRPDTRLDLLRACQSAPLSTADVAAGLRTVSDAIDECYERERRARPELRGELQLHFRVMPDGAFEDVRVTESTIPSESLSACIVEIVRGVRIPHGSSEGPANFTFPYAFEP